MKAHLHNMLHSLRKVVRWPNITCTSRVSGCTIYLTTLCDVRQVFHFANSFILITRDLTTRLESWTNVFGFLIDTPYPRTLILCWTNVFRFANSFKFFKCFDLTTLFINCTNVFRFSISIFRNKILQHVGQLLFLLF